MGDREKERLNSVWARVVLRAQERRLSLGRQLTWDEFRACRDEVMAEIYGTADTVPPARVEA